MVQTAEDLVIFVQKTIKTKHDRAFIFHEYCWYVDVPPYDDSVGHDTIKLVKKLCSSKRRPFSVLPCQTSF